MSETNTSNERETKVSGEWSDSSVTSRFNRRTYLKGAIAVGALGGIGTAPVAATAHNGTVLILDSTVEGGANSLEADTATALGYDVDIVDDATWGAMSTADFASYRAIILGDPECVSNPSPVAAAEANVGTWAPAVTGNVIAIGTDPQWHSTYGPGGDQGGDQLTESGIAFAADDEDQTGAYITLSCYYHGTSPGTPVPVLDGFGSFTVKGVGCHNDIAIVAAHPALDDLEEPDLSNWSCSVHEAFDTWPIDFEVLAMAVGTGEEFTAPDGTEGTPYILARGVEVISDISLAPETAQLPVGQTHDLVATVEVDDDPYEGADVTFTVIDGPHETTSGVATTDANGEATFSYTGTAVGEDTIEAEFTDPTDVTQRSNRVTAEWVEPEIESECVDLLAGQDEPVGEVCVVNDGDTLYVEYTTDDGCKLVESHLAISTNEPGSGEWTDRQNRWQNRSGNPAPGRFPHSADHDPRVDAFEYTTDLIDITDGVESGDVIYVAAHAVVKCDDGCETAWGDGDRFVDRGNWATYFTYEVQ